MSKLKTIALSLIFCLISIIGWAQKSGTEISGDVIQLALPIAAFTSSFVWNDEGKAPVQFIKTMGTSFILTHSLKWIINKPRPNGGEHSFPSGHTSSAFTGAAFLERRYGWKVGIPAYLLAGYVGWTRVDANKHDYWDILGGALIGIGSAYIFTKPYKESNVKLSVGKNGESYQIRIVALLNK